MFRTLGALRLTPQRPMTASRQLLQNASKRLPQTQLQAIRNTPSTSRALSQLRTTAVQQPLRRFFQARLHNITRPVQRRTFRTTRARRSQPAEPTPKAPEQPLTLRERLKKMSREYGWTAVGVYLTLSVLDFPFCFLFVKVVGTDRIAVAEHYVTSTVSRVIPESVKEAWKNWTAAFKKAEKEELGSNNVSQDVEMVGWGVKEAQEKNKEEASLATQLALAYAIHKSFIFIRVPLTAAILPKVVKVLRGWGYQIGKRKPKVA